MRLKTNRKSKSRSKRRTTAEREALKAKTRAVLSREIGFIPNPGFREMDADRFWQSELAGEKTDSAGDDVNSRGRHLLPGHLESLCAAPLLSHEEERQLFCRMNYLKYRANAIRSTLNASRPSVRKLEAVEQLMSRANQLRNRIVKANTRLVVSIVKKFADEKNPFDELLSEGINCLLKVVDKFDFDRGFRFSTYATTAVRRELYRLIQRSQRDRMRFATGSDEVLDELVDKEMLAERTESALLRIDRSVTKLLNRLDEREQFIVKARHGLIDLGMKPTFAKLGEMLGVSKERVRQLDIRAMNKLRELVEEFQVADPGSAA